MTSPPFYRGVPPLQSNSYVLALENLNRFVRTTKASKNYMVEILNDFGLNGGGRSGPLRPRLAPASAHGANMSARRFARSTRRL